MHLLLEISLSLGDPSSKDLSLGLPRHLAEILWLREGDRLQHMAPILRNFLEKGKSQHASVPVLLFCTVILSLYVIFLPTIFARNNALRGSAACYYLVFPPL